MYTTHVTCNQSLSVQGKYLYMKYFVQLSVWLSICLYLFYYICITCTCYHLLEQVFYNCVIFVILNKRKRRKKEKKKEKSLRGAKHEHACSNPKTHNTATHDRTVYDQGVVCQNPIMHGPVCLTFLSFGNICAPFGHFYELLVSFLAAWHARDIHLALTLSIMQDSLQVENRKFWHASRKFWLLLLGRKQSFFSMLQRSLA